MTYNPNIPAGTQNLSASQSAIRTNFAQANTLIARDHFAFDDATSANRALHRKISFPVVLSTDPSVIDPASYVYTKTIDTVTQLFFANSAGVVQLTGQDEWDNANSRGTFVVGTTRYNYGFITVATGGGVGTGTATFHTAFSAAPRSITVTPQSSGGTATDSFWVTNALAASCVINQSGPSSISARVFYYQAIGPV
jgi:hypothetical protein